MHSFMLLISAVGMVQAQSGYKTMMVIGHRGACGYAPENTLASFKKAIELGVDMIELDVHLCASGQLVVIHDETLERTTNGTGKVADKTLHELRALNAGNGQQIPMLAEVFDLVNRRVKINIELKGVGTAQSVAQLIKEYVNERGWRYDDFLISSFDFDQLSAMRKLSSAIKIAVLIEKTVPLNLISFAQFINAFAIVTDLSLVTEQLIAAAHACGMKFCVFHGDDPPVKYGKKEIERLCQLGVDGIILDFPDQI